MEEAPTPTILEKFSETSGSIEHIKKFLAIYKENIKYEITMYKIGNYLFIETEIEKDSRKIKYYNNYDLETLKRINKFLALCDNIDDIIDTLYENSEKNCRISENNNTFEIKIPVPVKNIKEISFILKEKKKETKEIINDLILDYRNISKKIEEQEKKN